MNVHIYRSPSKDEAADFEATIGYSRFRHRVIKRTYIDWEGYNPAMSVTAACGQKSQSWKRLKTARRAACRKCFPVTPNPVCGGD